MAGAGLERAGLGRLARTRDGLAAPAGNQSPQTTRGVRWPGVLGLAGAGIWGRAALFHYRYFLTVPNEQ